MQNHSDTMAQPLIRNMMLGAVFDGQSVDVGTLPQGVQWKHVSVTDVIRIDDMYTALDAEPAGVVDGAGTRWMDYSVYADVTLTSGAPTTQVPTALHMHDKLLLVSLTMRNLSDAETAAVRAVRGMGRAHNQAARDARGELQAYVTADPHRWQEVKGHMANAVPPQADLLKMKLRVSTWEDTNPFVAGTGHYLPTKGSPSCDSSRLGGQGRREKPPRRARIHAFLLRRRFFLDQALPAPRDRWLFEGHPVSALEVRRRCVDGHDD